MEMPLTANTSGDSIVSVAKTLSEHVHRDGGWKVEVGSLGGDNSENRTLACSPDLHVSE